MSGQRIAHLVLTGGPGAGKSTAMSYLSEQLEHRGWRVLVAPEAATLLIAGGVHDIGHLASVDRTAYLGVQAELVGLQVDLRARYHALAAALGAPKVVVLHDRGVCDNAAYMDAVEFREVLERLGLSPAGALDLYDAVLHLRSAAVPRGDYDGSAYTTVNNVARSEDADAAAALDSATLAGWAAHPHLAIVAPDATFAAKLQRTLAAATHALGDPEPLEIERKFVLEHAPDLNHPLLAEAVTVEIEQIYLPAATDSRSQNGAPADEQRIRARTLAGVTTYTHATKTDAGHGTRVEVERPISEQTYRLLAQLRDPRTAVVRKTRRMFLDADQRFELDHIVEPRQAWVLEAELVSMTDDVQLPDFLPPCREVTGERSWRNRALATR